jgi:hypothetical protein
MVFALPLPGDEPATGSSEQGLSTGQSAGGLFLFLGFVCVWWSEILGDALWVGRGAWNPIPSTGGVVRLLGWIFLIGVFVVQAVLRHRAMA